MIFLVMNDIDIHQLNLRPLKTLQFLAKNHSKNVFFCILEQQIYNKLLFLGKNHYLKKNGKIL